VIVVYGLRNCDTCRRALKWLQAQGIEHRFHDVRKDGVEAAWIARWAAAVGWERLLNRRGVTWRGLADKDKAGMDEARATALMAAHPALIKRPVFEMGVGVVVGFTDAEKAWLAQARVLDG